MVRASLLLAFIAASCAGPTPAVFASRHRQAIPVEWTVCPATPPMPKLPPRLRTVDEIAQFARRAEKARELTVAALEICRANHARLRRMIEED